MKSGTVNNRENDPQLPRWGEKNTLSDFGPPLTATCCPVGTHTVHLLGSSAALPSVSLYRAALQMSWLVRKNIAAVITTNRGVYEEV